MQYFKLNLRLIIWYAEKIFLSTILDRSLAQEYYTNNCSDMPESQFLSWKEIKKKQKPLYFNIHTRGPLVLFLSTKF